MVSSAGVDASVYTAGYVSLLTFGVVLSSVITVGESVVDES